jgi:D-alanyl-D-alanine carboxypeptidase
MPLVGLGVSSIWLLSACVTASYPDAGLANGPDLVVVAPEVTPPVESAEPEAVETSTEGPVFDRELYSIDDPASLWVIVNKARTYVPEDYVPENLVVPDVPSSFEPLLRAEAANALRELFDAAEAEGISLKLHSSYRSYRLQKRVKAQSVERFGQEVSDGRSARAGHSEHQSGLAADLTTLSGVCTLQECFGQTQEGRWLADNSWRFGFILRYLEGATHITGYVYEPWHFRYVGLELAEEIWNQGYPTLEEFFSLDYAPVYPD